MRKPATVAKTNPMTKPPAMAARNAAGGISYGNQIAPLLQSRCGRCHGGNGKGGFSVTSYAAIRRGSEGGAVFFPGKGQGSRLIELLETGEMPKGGGQFSPDEVALVSKWIDQGAVYDSDPTEMASSAGGGGGGNSTPTGKETVSFMNDIAPVLVENCVKCHGGDRGADNLEIETFAELMKGGRTGPIVTPGLPSSSLIIQMIEGTARDKTGPRKRMPDKRPPLSAEVIAKFRTWIAEGAKFDGDDKDVRLASLLRVIMAHKATHEELSKMRDELAKKNWATGNPGLASVTVEADDFRMVGDLTPVRMNELAELAKGVQAKVATALRATPGKHMYKGRVTIFVFNKRFEYTEFVQMVEKREAPSDAHGHFHYDVVDGYMCVLNNQEGDPNLSLLLAEGFAGSYIETLGKRIPRWFAIGAGRAVAAKMDAHAPLVKQWEETAMAGATSIGKPEQFFKSKELDATGSAVAFIIGKAMAPRLQTALDLMRKKVNFNNAILQAYGAPPQAMIAAWLKY
jgi:mono/diheme cytochrome c family protein